MSSSFISYGPGKPCPICGTTKSNKCRRNTSGLFFCHYSHHGQYASGFKYIKEDKNGVWGIYAKEGEYNQKHQHRRPQPIPDDPSFISVAAPTAASSGQQPANQQPTNQQQPTEPAKPSAPPAGVTNHINRYAENLDEHHDPAFYEQLGLKWWHAVPFGTRYLSSSYIDNRPQWVTPEKDGLGNITGWNFRFIDGTKKTYGPRGLFYADNWMEKIQLFGIFCPEGLSDCIALESIGLAAVGRPNNVAGVRQLADLFSGQPKETPIFILAENDRKEDGRWPGKSGAMKVAQELANILGRQVYWVLPPDGYKDVRHWYEEMLIKFNQQHLASGFLTRLFNNHCHRNAVACHPGNHVDTGVLLDLALTEEELGDSFGKAIEEERLLKEELKKTIDKNRQAGFKLGSLDKKSGCGVCLSKWKDLGICVKTRCGSWFNCAYCRYLNIQTHKIHFRMLLAHKYTGIYLALVHEDELPNLKKEIYRLRKEWGFGDYKDVAQSGGYSLLVSNVPFTDSEKAASPEAALARINNALDNLPRFLTGRNPITSSNGWKIPREEKKGYIDLGRWGTNLHELREFLEGFKEVEFLPVSSNGPNRIGGNSTEKSPTIVAALLFRLKIFVTVEILDNLRGWIGWNSTLEPGEWMYPLDRSVLTPPPTLKIGKSGGGDGNSDGNGDGGSESSCPNFPSSAYQYTKGNLDNSQADDEYPSSRFQLDLSAFEDDQPSRSEF